MSIKETIIIRKITKIEVSNYMRDLSKTKANGWDYMNIDHLKEPGENSINMLIDVVKCAIP